MTLLCADYIPAAMATEGAQFKGGYVKSIVMECFKVNFKPRDKKNQTNSTTSCSFRFIFSNAGKSMTPEQM